GTTTLCTDTPLIKDIVTIMSPGIDEVLNPATTWSVGTATTTKNVPPSAPDTLPACVGTNLCTANASGVSTSPISGNLRYIVNSLGGSGSNVANLTLHVDLGTLQATTRYKPAT